MISFKMRYMLLWLQKEVARSVNMDRSFLLLLYSWALLLAITGLIGW